MSDGDMSALYSLLAVPVGGAIAMLILWAIFRNKE